MERRRTFQKLKDSCVELIQVVSTFTARPNARTDIVRALSTLLQVLQEITERPDSLDEKLAEFVFVPISEVLRLSQKVPVRALELSLGCTSILIQSGWKGNLSKQLFSQLFILFTFLANPSSAQNGIPETSEELQVAAFKCMSEAVAEIISTTEGRDFLTETTSIPSLSQAVLVMAESITESTSNDVKLQALSAISAVCSGISDKDALASFAPRLISSLTKILTPSSGNRANFRVVVRGLEVLSLVFLRVLSDRETEHLPSEAPTKTPDNEKVLRTTSWLHATASQIKVALANVLKLRHHNKHEVQYALLQVCLRVLQDCRKSLSDCSSMAIEAIVHLAGRNEQQVSAETNLKLLLSMSSDFSSLLRESLYGWVIALPRIMQSRDDATRRQIIHQISVALRLLNGEDIEITSINDVLAVNLHGSFSNVLKESRNPAGIVETPYSSNVDLGPFLGRVSLGTFEALDLKLKGQEEMVGEFKLLIDQLAQSNSSNTVANDLVHTLGSGNQEAQVASFWLSVNLVRSALHYNNAVDEFLYLESSNTQYELLDELYAYSLSILSKLEIEPDWRLQALSLEVLAMQAGRYKHEFRDELIDALYPTLHLLGTQDPRLRHHAITCLNIMADACGYTSASELIVANVDYVVNAVGLKLNYHDISPQAPQVLLMMMRLCGSSLIPYLDDLVASIFSALERYHGYPKLVELLFSTLKAMAEEGVKSPQLLITHNKDAQIYEPWKPVSVLDIVALIRETRANSFKKDQEHKDESSFPRRPWKEDDEEVGSGENEDLDSLEDKGPERIPEDPPPAPKTFNLLLKISELTQYYLTSSSPGLRTSLLSLLHTTIPALAKHENSFLPLINTIWPVLVPRLGDPEAYIVSGALDIVTLLSTHAGNFMTSRIQDIWQHIKQLHHRTLLKVSIERPATKLPLASLTITNSNNASVARTSGTELDSFRPELYTDTPNHMIRESLIRLLSEIAKYVAVREIYFDDIIDMLDPVLDRIEVCRALESRNPDAIWLRLQTKTKQLVSSETDAEMVAMMGDMSMVSKIPESRTRWKFTRL